MRRRSANNTERREAAVKALSLAPDPPSALNNLAWDYVLGGQPKAGRDEYVQRLTTYEKGCVTPVAAPPAP